MNSTSAMRICCVFATSFNSHIRSRWTVPMPVRMAQAYQLRDPFLGQHRVRRGLHQLLRLGPDTFVSALQIVVSLSCRPVLLLKPEERLVPDVQVIAPVDLEADGAEPLEALHSDERCHACSAFPLDARVEFGQDLLTGFTKPNGHEQPSGSARS
jgi:hypothetical protein